MQQSLKVNCCSFRDFKRKPTLALQYCKCAPTLPSSVNETQDSFSLLLTASRRSFWTKRVKWETQNSGEEHFQDGWRCEERERQSTVAHWPSEPHQHYSPRPPGIVGTGGTGSLLKPLWSVVQEQKEIWTPISTFPAAPCSVCVGQNTCRRLQIRSSQRNRENLNDFKEKNISLSLMELALSEWRNLHLLSL